MSTMAAGGSKIRHKQKGMRTMMGWGGRGIWGGRGEKTKKNYKARRD